MKYKNLKRTGILFIIPFFFFYIAFNLYPIIYTFFLSLTNYDGYADPVFIGIKNYLDLFSDKTFWAAFLNTWQIWLPNIIMQMTLALTIAAIFTNIRLRIKGKGIFRAVFYFPNLVTAASIALLFVVLLDWQFGAFNQILFGDNKDLYVNWMVNSHRAKFVVSIIQTWMWFGHSLIILMAGIEAIPTTFYEAAEVDGANEVQKFFKITIPLLAPILTYVMVTSLIGGMQIFDIPYVIGNGPMVRGTAAEQGLQTMVAFLYNRAFRYNRFGYASAVSYVLFVLTALFSFVYLKVTSGSRKEAK
ncbi:MAG: sugar ABC transporter permease [Spirochaetes bacterium]|nr:sugar ABC transporter permease [Spirochaetota bacterium]